MQIKVRKIEKSPTLREREGTFEAANGICLKVKKGRQSRCLNSIRAQGTKKKARIIAGGRDGRKNLIVEEIKGKQEFTFLARGVLLRHQKQQAFRRWIECAPYRHLCDST